MNTVIFMESLSQNEEFELGCYRVSQNKNEYIVKGQSGDIVFQKNKSATSFWELCQFLGI